MSEQTTPPTDENQLIAERREKLKALREAHRNGRGPAFPNDFKPADTAAALFASHGEATKEALEGTWKTETSWWGVKEGAIDLVSVSDKIPAETREQVDKIKAGLKDGSFVIWKGPIVGQDGKEVLKKDEVADDKFLHGVTFYVKGVEGKVPN